MDSNPSRKSFRTKRVLAIIPARGGSKGIKDKNLRLFLGVPLVSLAIRIARRVKFIDRVLVSSDDPRILEIARAEGLDTPFRRPADISGDRVADVVVLQHAAEEAESFYGETYEIIAMLQPTSPLRTTSEVESAFELYLERSFKSLWTLNEIDLKYHSYKQLRVLKDGSLEFVDQRGHRIIARQQLDRSFIRNGELYIISKDVMQGGSLLGEPSYGWISRSPGISIDSLEDLVLAERIANSSALFDDEILSNSHILSLLRRLSLL